MLRFTISNEREQQSFDHAEGPIEFAAPNATNVPRCIVQDLYVSKDHVRVDEIEGGRVRVETEPANSIRLADNSVIPRLGAVGATSTRRPERRRRDRHRRRFRGRYHGRRPARDDRLASRQ